jgi:hypothetical protein
MEDFNKTLLNHSTYGKFGLKEGPTLIEVPAQAAYNYKSCMGCKYKNHQLVRSGFNPIYKNNCEHPDLPENIKSKSYNYYDGNLDNILLNGKTPDWCPYIVKENEENNKKINNYGNKI